MKHLRFVLLALICCAMANGQVYSSNNDDGRTYRYLMDDDYFIETVFEQKDGKFVATRGGFYTKAGDEILVTYEFNSSFEKDRKKTHSYTPNSSWKNISTAQQALSGKWLMAGRVKAEGEQRRDLTRSRKTMKILLDGHFQWIAFDTASMRFVGSGGGTYSAENGDYVEHIDYFSKDNTKVGKILPFRYHLKGNDWYHKGLNSKGAPLHEIWQKRSVNP